MTRLQLVAALAAVLLLFVIFELVRRRRLLERYALVWLAVGVILVILGVWRGLLTALSDAAGIAAPPNALFAAGLLLLLVLVLDLSVAVSRLSDQTKVLAQRVALLEERIEAPSRTALTGLVVQTEQSATAGAETATRGTGTVSPP